MQKVIWFLFAVWCQVVALSAQEVVNRTVEAKSEFTEVASDDKFHESILKAAAKRIDSAQAGAEKIKARADYWRIRRAMLLPKVREYVKEMVLTQIRIEVAHGADNVAVPVVDGRVDVAAIDWEALLAFLEKLIPLIITLIGLFGLACYHRFFYLIFTKGGV